MKIGFVGSGVITEAIVTGLMKGEGSAHEIIISHRNSEVSARLAKTYGEVRVEQDNQTIIDDADLVILSVIPQIAEEVVTGLTFRQGMKLISLIATVTHEKLQSWILEKVDIVRAIPLPFVANKTGLTAIFPQDATAYKLFSGLGDVIQVDSLDRFDAIAVTSAHMGTYFGVLENGAQWLVSKGVPYPDARRYVASLFLRLGETAYKDSNISFDALREGHSTPGGLNEQLFHVFSGNNGLGALNTALDDVLERVRSSAS